jgi:hypothetical protein
MPTGQGAGIFDPRSDLREVGMAEPAWARRDRGGLATVESAAMAEICGGQPGMAVADPEVRRGRAGRTRPA